jgi:hypothetical protein
VPACAPLKSPSESVDTFPTCTWLDVTPVWSEKALDGMGRDVLPVVDEPLPVVVVDEELVELQAATPSPTARTTVSAVVRLFQELERKAPPR